MKPDEFIGNLIDRYPQIAEHQHVRGDIERELSHYSEEKIDKLWDEFIDEYAYGRMPRWADISRLAKNASIFPHVKSSIKGAYNHCTRCTTSFSSEARHCPVCGRGDAFEVRSGKRPRSFYPMREDCGQCRYYMASDHMDFGPLCEHYATEKSNKLSDCKRCVCHRCCFEQYAMRRAHDGDRTLFDKLDGEGKWEDRMIKEDRNGL